MVSLVMDDLSSCSLARPFGPMSPTLMRRQPMASAAVAVEVAVAAPPAVAAKAAVALSIACLHLTQNGRKPMSSAQDYRK